MCMCNAGRNGRSRAEVVSAFAATNLIYSSRTRRRDARDDAAPLRASLRAARRRHIAFPPDLHVDVPSEPDASRGEDKRRRLARAETARLESR